MGFLKGKKALIIGVASNRSIAWGIAESMAANGCEIAFTYQTEKLKSRVEKCAEICKSSIVIPCDVSSDEEIKETFDELQKSWDSFDILIHSVAFAERAELDGNYLEVTTREGFLKAHEISSYSFTALAKAAMPMLNKNGALLTLSYLGALRAIPNYNVMGIAKASLEANVRYMAAAMGAEKGIRVNAIAPGYIKTKMVKHITNDKLSNILSSIKMKRPGKPIDVANVALFLASDLSTYVTGQVIGVDGGMVV